MREGKRPSRIRRRRVAGSERTLEARTALAYGEAAATGTRRNIETEVKIIMKRHLRPVAALAAAALLAGGLLTSSPATAAENPASSPSAQHPLDGPVSQLSAAEERALSRLESATDTATGVFDAEAALAAGVSASDVADYAATYTAAGNDVVGMTSSVDAQTTPQARTVAAAAATCSGARGYTGFWGWGWQTALDSCDTD